MLAEQLAGAGYHVVAAGDAPVPRCDLIVTDRHLDPAAAAVLDLGTLPRPLRLGTLLARIAAMLERAPNLRIGPWRLDAAARTLEDAAGRRVRLTDKEAAILAYLSAAPGGVARETLLAEVWGYSAAVTTHTLETHIYRLRRKIERDPSAAELLVTEEGGYRLKLD